MLGDNPASTVFIDVMTCFAVVIMMIAIFTPVGNSMPAPASYPIVNIFIYKGDKPNDYYTVMNGFEVSVSELRRSILLAKKEFTVVKGRKKRTIFAVQVIAGVDEDIPFSYFEKINEGVVSLNSGSSKKQKFVVVWKDYKLSAKEKKEKSNAKRKKN